MSACRRILSWISFSLLVNVIVVMLSIKMRCARGLVVDGWTVLSPLLAVGRSQGRVGGVILGAPRRRCSTPRANTRRWLASVSDPSAPPPPAPRRPQRWKAGDQVSFTADGRMRSGTIVESNGGGWFRVLLDDSTVRSLRTYQLQPPVLEAPEEPVSVNHTYSIESTLTVLEDAVPSDLDVGASPSIKGAVPLGEAPSNSETATRTIEPAIGSDAEFTAQMPPPPTIFDLDAEVRALQTDPARSYDNVQYLRQVENHMRYNRWVVFTDLHCSPATLDTCLQVLDRVHDLAVKNQAGVLFLGDFWHHRGVLRVECLNAVLRSLSRWTQPMVLIPGNHDQVTLGGHLHSLTPLENAYRVVEVARDSLRSGSTDTLPGPLIFSHPTKFRDALLVPHIRDPATMESVLQSNVAQDSSAVLVHADVTGAYMNDMIISSGGVPPSMFPKNKAIYSGHFHKPHVVRSSGRTIEYLGSPYQVSLAEAQQEKSLAILDASKGWKCIERIPIAIGRKHFRVASLFDFLELQPTASTDSDGSSMHVRPGDRVVLSLDRSELTPVNGEETAVSAHATLLRKSGAVVEIREVKNVPIPLGRSEEELEHHLPEELSLESTLTSYLRQEVLREEISNDTAEVLLSFGLDILASVESSEELNIDNRAVSTSDLVLKDVKVEGFGPFQGTLTYPLANRGLVLLRGVNRDGGSDSNGSGKSSLAMAALWCLTGSMDSRPAQDSKVADVVNGSSKTARVTVRGTLNGVEFSVTRSKSATKSGLVFRLGDSDLTAQSPKETQATIQERLGINHDLLGRVVFHGQHGLNGLLEATDSEFKEQLALVVPLTDWQSASTMSRKRAADAKKESNELMGMLSIRTVDREKAQAVLEKSRHEAATIHSKSNDERTLLLAQIKELADDSADPRASRDDMEKQLNSASSSVQTLQGEKHSRLESHRQAVQPLEQQLTRLRTSLSSLDEACNALVRERIILVSKVCHAEDRLRDAGNVWGIDTSSGLIPDIVVLPESCPTCKQPLGGPGGNHEHDLLQTSIHKEVIALSVSANEARVELEALENELAATTATRDEVDSCVRDMQESLDAHLASWTEEALDLDRRLELALSNKDQAIVMLSQYAKSLDKASRLSDLKSQLEALDAALASSRSLLSKAQEEFDSFSLTVGDLQTQLDRQRYEATTFSKLTDVLGPRGIQAFVLSNAVRHLQSLTQEYLDELSDGSLRLQIAIDSGDRITRRAQVREADGDFRERSLSSLSGGQWRRCSLALTLGYIDWVSRRGHFRSSALFLDEPFTHLDRSGRADVGRLLRRLLPPADVETAGHVTGGMNRLQVSTIVLILQDLAAEELEEAFDSIDVVIKESGKSSVQVNVSS